MTNFWKKSSLSKPILATPPKQLPTGRVSGTAVGNRESTCERSVNREAENGRDMQLGLASDDTDPTLEPEFKAKATEVVAKKVAFPLELLNAAKKSWKKPPKTRSRSYAREKQVSPKCTKKSSSTEKPKPKKINTRNPYINRSRWRSTKQPCHLLSWDRMRKQELFCPSCATRCLNAANATQL